MEIILYNNFNNGDVFFSRAIINLIHKIFPNHVLTYKHSKKKGLLKDYDFIVEESLDVFCDMEQTIRSVDNKLYVNTWYGQNHRNFMARGGGTTLRTVQLIIQNIQSYLNTNVQISEIDIYPTVDYEKLKININLIKNNILICNDDSVSGQSNNMDLEPIISYLSQKYKDIMFYVTKKTNFFSENITYIDDLLTQRPNLLEVSYISNYSSIIIGRCSGPYSYCMTKENILDANKSLVAICNDYINGIWSKYFFKCNYIHLYTNDLSNVQNIIENEIERKFNKSNI
jgi:hypothetical protein